MTTELEIQDEVKAEITTATLAERAENLSGKIHQLQMDLQQRKDSLETNILSVKREAEGTMQDLRDQYDACINRGDKKAADQVLGQIASARGKLVDLAKHITGESGDLSDLEARAEKLRREGLPLSKAATKNHIKARKLDDSVSGLLRILSDQFGRDIREIKRMFDEAKKVCKQILSE